MYVMNEERNVRTYIKHWIKPSIKTLGLVMPVGVSGLVMTRHQTYILWVQSLHSLWSKHLAVE